MSTVEGARRRTSSVNVAAYVKHARRFGGLRDVFDAARKGGLGSAQLLRLAAELETVDRRGERFRLSGRERAELRAQRRADG